MTLRLATFLLVLLTSTAGAADAPAGYPADYAKLIEAAEKEGKLVVYAATDAAVAQQLLKAFAEAFPKIQVDYQDLDVTELYNRVRAEVAAGGSGDVAWSSAMDLQVKLAQDGYAQTYASPEKPHLPGWAVFREQAYATTYEPVTFVYNKRRLPEAPTSHDDFIRLLTEKKAELRGRVTTFDPERSDAGFAFLSNDLKQFPRVWALAAALGGVDVKLYTSPGTMLERIGSGDSVLGYNMIGSYALSRASKDPNVGVVFPQDYIQIFSRVMLIPAKAHHPNAARVFFDFVLSQPGQKALTEGGLFAIRDDVAGETSARALQTKFGDRLRPTPIDESLTQTFDRTKRFEVLRKWQEAIAKR
jgi:iron(III) transport system substrate-binding protein